MPTLDELAQQAGNAVAQGVPPAQAQPQPGIAPAAPAPAPTTMPSLVGDQGVTTFDELMGDTETVDEVYTRSLKHRDESEVMDFLRREAEAMGTPLEVGSDTNHLWERIPKYSFLYKMGQYAPGIVGDIPEFGLGGVAAGLQNFANTPGAVLNFNPSILGGLQFTDPKTGETDIKWLGSEEWKQFEAAGGTSPVPEVPEIHVPMADWEPNTTVGKFAKMFIQYLTALGLVAKVTGGLGVGYSVKALGKRIGQYTIADFAAWDGQEGNIANLLQTFPALRTYQGRQGAGFSTVVFLL